MAARADAPAFSLRHPPHPPDEHHVIPETGWTLDYAAEARPVRKRGTHGFDNRDRDMHMVFYASGPAFRKGYRQGSFQNQNMYLILCRLLGIEPAPNDGEWKEIKRMFRDNDNKSLYL